jgi:hypothetical protein
MRYIISQFLAGRKLLATAAAESALSIAAFCVVCAVVMVQLKFDFSKLQVSGGRARVNEKSMKAVTKAAFDLSAFSV